MVTLGINVLIYVISSMIVYIFVRNNVQNVNKMKIRNAIEKLITQMNNVNIQLRQTAIKNIKKIYFVMLNVKKSQNAIIFVQSNVVNHVLILKKMMRYQDMFLIV